MSDLAVSVVRELAQKLVGMAALWLVARGLDVPAAVTDWAVLTLVTGGLVVWTTVVRWFETRYGDGPLARFARAVGRLLMLGVKTKPTYVAPPAQVEVRQPDRGPMRKSVR